MRLAGLVPPAACNVFNTRHPVHGTIRGTGTSTPMHPIGAPDVRNVPCRRAAAIAFYDAVKSLAATIKRTQPLHEQFLQMDVSGTLQNARLRSAEVMESTQPLHAELVAASMRRAAQLELQPSLHEAATLSVAPCAATVASSTGLTSTSQAPDSSPAVAMAHLTCSDTDQYVSQALHVEGHEFKFSAALSRRIPNGKQRPVTIRMSLCHSCVTGRVLTSCNCTVRTEPSASPDGHIVNSVQAFWEGGDEQCLAGQCFVDASAGSSIVLEVSLSICRSLEDYIRLHSDSVHHAVQYRQRDSVGIVNPASTCYMNAVLQSVYHTAYLRRAVYCAQRTAGAVSGKITFIQALQRLFYRMQYGDGAVTTQARNPAPPPLPPPPLTTAESGAHNQYRLETRTAVQSARRT
jgi:hypothetical protein